MPPPFAAATLLSIVTFRNAMLPHTLLYAPPPLFVAVLPVMVLADTRLETAEPLRRYNPPPSIDAFPWMVVLEIVAWLFGPIHMPPPASDAELVAIVAA